MDHFARLERLRRLQRILDGAYRIPGTPITFGWDAIIGLIPGGGDTLTALLACAFVVQAWQMRVPKVVQLRMIFNILIDVVIGLVPFAGDVGDVFWKANAKNLALLERHSERVQPARLGDWLFVLVMLAPVVAIIVLPLVMVYWYVRLVEMLVGQ